ncbi:MAG: hypothetical protein V3T23_11555, partial [Nitrososphaerales archaeon]
HSFSQEGELLTFKPHKEDLRYHLNIKAHSVVDMNSARQGSIFEDHNDDVTLTQKVSESDDGLLDIALTVEKINWKEHGPTNGKRVKREDIIGNTHLMKIDLLGKVKGVMSFPHFGSNEFYRGNVDGPALDHWRIMAMLYPQFPLNLIRKGESWETKEEFWVTPAEVLPISGLMSIRHDFEMKVRRETEYTLIDYVERSGYHAAHIGFESTFRTNGEVHGAEEGDYTEGNGKSSGDFYFSPKLGILVEATFKEHVIERKSRDGHFEYYLSPDKSLFAEAYDQKSIPFIWRTDKTIHFGLTR